MAPLNFLAAQPWDWLGPLVDAIREWLFSDAIRELPANAGLFLITGGLSILTLIVSLVFLQSVLPLRSNNPMAVQTLPAERELRPIDPSRPGRVLRPVAPGHTRAVSYHSLDSLLESLLATGLGEPRVLYHAPTSTMIRIYLCPGCQRVSTLPTEAKVCIREKNALQGAFSTFYRKNALATEVRCKQRGDSDCEFEVKH